MRTERPTPQAVAEAEALLRERESCPTYATIMASGAYMEAWRAGQGLGPGGHAELVAALTVLADREARLAALVGTPDAPDPAALAYRKEVFHSAEDEGFVAVAPDLPGSSAFGESEAEAIAELNRAIPAWIAACRAAGNPVPPPGRSPSARD